MPFFGHKQTEYSSGFALAYVLIILTVLLSTTAAMFTIIVKQVRLGAFAADAMHAYYLAESGLECVIYQNAQGVNFAGGQLFECGGDATLTGLTVSIPGHFDEDACAELTLTLEYDYLVVAESRGLSDCVSGPRRVERGVAARYPAYDPAFYQGDGTGGDGTPLGLVGHWTLDTAKYITADANSEAKDSSGNDYHGNAMSISTTPQAGSVGQALTFDGVDDKIEVTSDLEFDISRSTGFSASLWFRKSTDCNSPEGNEVMLTRHGTSHTQSTWWVGCIGSSDHFTGVLFDSTGELSQVESSAVIDNNVWHHGVWVYDAAIGQFRLYLNNALVDTDNHELEANVTSNQPLCIGRYKNGSTCDAYEYGGRLDDIRIYDYALSAAQINSLYQLGTGSDTTPPVISNGAPSGTLAAGTTQATMSVITNENATCKWSTTDQAYSSMPNTFSSTGTINHSTTLTGLTNGSSYTRYVRCQDTAGNASVASTVISFSVSSGAANSLIAHWPLNETSGTTATDVASGYIGTLTNGPTWVAGLLNNGVNFDGTNDYISVPHQAALNLPRYSVSVWARSTIAGNTTGNRKALSKDEAFNINWNHSTLGPSCEHRGSGTWYNSGISGQTLSANTWYLLTCVYDGSTLRLYRNNTLMSSNTVTTNPDSATTDAVHIGARSILPINQLFIGILDDVRIYNYALSASEISALYAAGGAPDTTPPTISNGAPSGSLAAGTTQTTMSVTTNENASCKWSTSDQAYSSMPNTFSSTGATNHSTTLTGLTNGTSYTRYVRCQDTAGNPNTSSTVISFSVAVTGGSLPLDLSGSPVESGSVTVNVVKPAGADYAVIEFSGYNFDSDSEGLFTVNGNPATYLFNGEQGDGGSDSVTYVTLASWWVNGNNTVYFEHIASSGFTITDIDVTFDEGGFQMDLTQATEAVGAITVSKSGSPSTAYIDITGYDMDTDSEGRLYINGNGPVLLFNEEQGASGQVTYTSPASWWTDGGNSLYFQHPAGDGFVIVDVDVSFNSLDTTPPTISNGSPSGTLSSGTTQTTMSVTTDENASCKWSTSDQAYASMPNTFSSTGATNHSTTLTGLTNGSSYTRYVRCQDTAGNPNTSSTVISFSVGQANALVGHWRLNESSGTTASDIASGYTGTLTNGPTWTTGVLGNAIAVDGVDDYISIPHQAALNLPRYTISAWARGTVAGNTTGIRKVVSKDSGYNINWSHSSLGPSCEHRGTSAWYNSGGTAQTLNANTWYLLTCVYDGSTLKFYRNNTLVSSNAVTTDPDSTITNAVYIGARSFSPVNQLFIGAIDDVRIYNYALNDSQIAALYTAGSPDASPPVISNGAPSGTLSSGTTQTTMSVTTNENASCKWSTSDQAYASMPNTFSSTGATNHSTTLTGLVDDTSYTRYVRCQDTGGNANTSSTVISFSVASANELVHHWTFNESSGTTAADSAGGAHGTLTNGPTWVAGRIGNGLQFDGTNDFVLIGSPTLPTEDFTVALWARPLSYNFSYNAILSASDSPTQTSEIGLFIRQAGGALSGYVNNSERVAGTDAGDPKFTIGSWSHAVLTREGGAIKLYMNGVEVAAATNGITLNFHGCPMHIGADSDEEDGCTASLSDYFHGIIDDVRVYNYALTPSQVNALYTGS